MGLAIKSIAAGPLCGTIRNIMIWLTIHRLRSSSPDTRTAAARKLGESGVRHAVPSLLRTLQDEDAAVRTAAAEALARIPHPAAADPLATALEGAATPRMGKTETGVGEFKALAEALAAQGKDAAQPAIRLLASQHKDARLWAAWALGRIGSSAAVSALTACLEDRRSDVRSEAALALGAIADPSGLEPLVRAMDNRDPDTRRAAAEALRWFDDEKSLHALEAATRDSDEDVQLAAVASLASTGKVSAALRLKAAIESERKAVREAALSALNSPALQPQDPDEAADLAVLRGDNDAALAAGEAAIPHLLDAMRSRDPRRRVAASRALRQVRPVHAIPTFLRALRDPEPAVREAVTEALAEIGHDAVEGLVEALSSPDAGIQHYAAIALGRIGDPAVAQALASVISRNRRTSEEYAEPLQAARTAAYALHSLLRSRPESIAAEHLHQICDVPDVLVEKPSLKDPQAVVTEIGMDCSLIRDLARQELSRRNAS